MKSIAILVLVLSTSFFSYSQEKKMTSKSPEEIKAIELPEIIITRAGKDFSIYFPEYNTEDLKIKAMQDAFIGYDLGKDYEGYEDYLVIMTMKDASLAATYNEKGKLTRVAEKYNNVKLPHAVIYSIYREYPGWSIVNDKFLYTQEDGDIVKKQYNIKLKKDNKTRRIVVTENGAIIKG